MVSPITPIMNVAYALRSTFNPAATAGADAAFVAAERALPARLEA
jgi:hypothetical protein